MTPAAEDWTRFAEAAYATALREHAATETPNPAAVCHAAQRCAVGYLRARLTQGNIPHPDLAHPVVLLECCLELEPAWEPLRAPLRVLHVNALDVEHPGAGLDPQRAEKSLRACEAVRASLTGTRE